MAYLGNVPARSFISFERQVFTIVNSQTAYTLSHSVTNENDIRLVVNNVVQEPGSGKAYTASGTTLTLSAALVNGTDEMYCVFLGRAVGTVNAPAGSVGTSQLAADAVTNAKIADDAISDEQLDPTVITGQTAETSIATDDLILLSDTSASGALKKMTRANFVSGIGGANTPAFLATAGSTSQTISNTTFTKINFGTEILDTDSAYDTSASTFTIPSGKGGVYIFYHNMRMPLGNTEERTHMINVDGSDVLYSGTQFYPGNDAPFYSTYTTMLNLSAGDVCYLNTYVTSTGTRTTNANYTYFGGYKLIT